MEWVSKITTVALEMVLPGIGGMWLDAKFGTSFVGMLGFVLGLVVGIWHLVQMTKPGQGDRQSPLPGTDESNSRE